MPTNLLEFWPKVYSFQDVAGAYHYKELAQAILNMLSISTSNACIERVFSIMTLTKTKLRSRMQYELLESLLKVNIHCNANDMCCQSFTPSKEMLDKFNSKCMYSIKNSKDGAIKSEVYELMYN